jgi:hypothetical protein
MTPLSGTVGKIPLTNAGYCAGDHAPTYIVARCCGFNGAWAASARALRPIKGIA